MRAVLRKAGYDVVPSRERNSARPALPPDCDPFTASVVERIAPYTLTTPERIIALVDAIRYIVRAGIPGAMAECGVWRGGSVLAMAYTLLDLETTDRDLFLFDTFGPIPPPGEHDLLRSGKRVADIVDEAKELAEFRHLPEERLKELLFGTGYPPDRFHLVKGPVEHTLPGKAPDRLALCRLDTDLYESTAHELVHLWPRLSSGGVLLVDDYGQFMGAKKAVDEYFEAAEEPVLLHRLDHSGRLIVKPH